ncbi:MAG: 2-amino-4-hydroxy-6-hydroxymethyldihydropteridine diphosphokinase [Gammaproteobacteria bacterium]|nr:2-amino-4-hydroxy-6-hydroxymethyldihydropteridine diphosphokinase [Gammaproteobacteria bacterium]
MARVYLSLGSNINREQNIRGALHELHKLYGTLTISRVFESESVGFEGDAFYNLAVGLDTDDDVLSINDTIHHIEDQFGRVRSGPRFSSRTLDIDLLLYDELIIKQGKLELPRDEITKNAFVLWPLAEIAPELIHPVLGISMHELWQQFDQASQTLYPVDFDSSI